MQKKKISLNGAFYEGDSSAGGTLLQEARAAVMMRGHRREHRGACRFYAAFKRICKV